MARKTFKQVSQSIKYKDLFPVVVAAFLWAPPMGLQMGQLPIPPFQWWKFCGLTLQEPLPSCPWFAICPY